MRIVVDTNIAFCALAANRGDLSMRLFTTSESKFYAPRFLFVELFKHKDRILQATRLSENDLLEALNILIESIHFIDALSIPMGVWIEARRLCNGIDLKDTPFIAMTIHLDALLWTEDAELKSGLSSKGFDRFFIPR